MKTDKDLERIIVCAERYACGRQTFIPETVVKYIHKHMHALSTECLNILYDDLQRRVDREMLGAKGVFGNEKYDRPLWINLMNEIAEEIAGR